MTISNRDPNATSNDTTMTTRTARSNTAAASHTMDCDDGCAENADDEKALVAAIEDFQKNGAY